MRPSRASKCSAAFTLLELLCGLTVLLLLIVLLGQILTRVSSAWSSGEARKERLQNLRTITDFIGEELQAATLPMNRRDTRNLRFAVNPTVISPLVQNRDAIFWAAPYASNSTRGDLAVIGYFVRWEVSPTAPPKASLCRLFIEPNDTANYRIFEQNWVADDLLNLLASGTKISGYKGMVAENVVGIWVRCLDEYGKPIELDYNGQALPNGEFDSTEGYTDSKGKRSPDYIAADGTRIPYSALPRSVELSLAMLDGASAARLNASTQPVLAALAKASASADEFVLAARSNAALAPFREGLRSYQTRIYLRNSK